MPVNLSAFTGIYSYLNNVPKRSIHRSAIEDVPAGNWQSGRGILQDIGEASGGLSGEGVGRQRVNEPMFGVRSAPVSIPRTFQDDGVARSSRVTEYGNVRTTPLITTQKFKEPEVIMPGDELKMSLLKKLARTKKKNRLTKVRESKPEHKVSLSIVKEKSEKRGDVLKLATIILFPLLFKKIDPKSADVLKDKKKRTKVFATLEKMLKKSAKKPEFDKDTADKIGDVFAKIFGQMGINMTPDANKALKTDILSGLFKLKAGVNLSGGSKKSRRFWKSFGSSFLKTLKVGLPIIGVAGTLLGQPEVALAAGLAESLL